MGGDYMTIKDLKAKLSSIDDSYTLTLQKPDGTEMDITKASQQGDHFTFWTDSAS
jgi:hypothetical protein